MKRIDFDAILRLSLPLDERIALAQAIWDSLDADAAQGGAGGVR